MYMCVHAHTCVRIYIRTREVMHEHTQARRLTYTRTHARTHI